jgi:hypothetical protein
MADIAGLGFDYLHTLETKSEKLGKVFELITNNYEFEHIAAMRHKLLINM